MKKSFFFAKLAVLLLLCSCANVRNNSELGARTMGDHLVPSQLNKQSDALDGQRVVVHGWLRASFENYGIWDSRAAEQRGEAAVACVSLRVPDSMDTSDIDKSFVEVEGVFLKRRPRGTIALGGCNSTALTLDIDHPPVRLGRKR